MDFSKSLAETDISQLNIAHAFADKKMSPYASMHEWCVCRIRSEVKNLTDDGQL